MKERTTEELKKEVEDLRKLLENASRQAIEAQMVIALLVAAGITTEGKVEAARELLRQNK